MQARFFAVEDSLKLSVHDLYRWGALATGGYQVTPTWTRSRNGHVLSEDSIKLVTLIKDGDPDGVAILAYILKDHAGDTTQIRQNVILQRWAGRWHFICPRCHRAVRCIYKKPTAQHFHCRACCQLVYQSSRESSAGRTWGRAFVRAGKTASISRMFNSLGFPRLGHILQALRDDEERFKKHFYRDRDQAIADHARRVKAARTNAARKRWRNHKRREQRRAARIECYWQTK